jgi:hypothetical protein
MVKVWPRAGRTRTVKKAHVKPIRVQTRIIWFPPALRAATNATLATHLLPTAGEGVRHADCREFVMNEI